VRHLFDRFLNFLFLISFCVSSELTGQGDIDTSDGVLKIPVAAFSAPIHEA
jgi:hypothetical protein